MSFKSIVSAVMIFIQLIVMNVGYGLKESPHNETETPTEIVNDISSDEMSDSIKYAADSLNSVQGYFETGKNNKYITENKIQNGRMTAAYEYIMQIYHKCLEEDSFL